MKSNTMVQLPVGNFNLMFACCGFFLNHLTLFFVDSQNQSTQMSFNLDLLFSCNMRFMLLFLM